jgi:RimJ/RimL family protein N-acetyltransferase
MTIPSIVTPRLILRAFTEQDINPMYQILNQEEVLRYFPPSDAPSRDRAQRMILRLLSHWAERGYGLWAVETRKGGTLVGRCGLQFLPETEEVEVDFILGKPFWGQGFATEAGRASIRYGFEELRAERIVGIVHVENRASQRVLEKLGMEVVEQKQFFGMECYRYMVEHPSYDQACESWENAAWHPTQDKTVDPVYYFGAPRVDG